MPSSASLSPPAPRIAILGAGPIGLEAALFLGARGYAVQVYEQGVIGAHVQRWGHVPLFSPWRLNMSPWGPALLTQAAMGWQAPDPEAFPTGQAFLEQYLWPLAKHPLLAGRVHTGTRVLAVGRQNLLKGQAIGEPRRASLPFLLHLDGPAGEAFVQADAVVDATGVLGEPGGMGPGGLRALGEGAVASRVAREIPDLHGPERMLYLGKRVLVVGDGLSAVTTLKLLEGLRREAPETRLFWAFTASQAPYVPIAMDPLPQRAALMAFGNEAADGKIAGLTPCGASWVRALASTSQGAIEATLENTRGEQTVLEVDRIVANVGYRPNLELTRELQVHLCYASEGPMKLAAALLAASGGGGDCLAQTTPGPETLKTPEPGLFVLGIKSYGRGSQFLLRVGFEQIAMLEGLL